MAIVRIRNKQTGEVQEVDSSQLGNYGLQDPNQASFSQSTSPDVVPDNTTIQTQAPQQTGIAESVLSFFAPQIVKNLKLLANTPAEFKKIQDLTKTDKSKAAKEGLDYANSLVSTGKAAKLEGQSLAMPVEGGVGGLLATGALSGVLRGLSESQGNGDVLDKIVGGGTGGAIGGLAGGALGKVLGGAGKLFNKGADVLDTSATSKVLKASPTAASDAIANGGYDINTIQRELFGKETNIDKILGPKAAENRGGMWVDHLNNAEQTIQQGLRNAGDQVVMTKNDLLAPLYAQRVALAKTVGNGAKIKALDEVIKETESKFAQGVTADGALALKRTADKSFGKAVVEDTKGAISSQAQKILGNEARATLRNKFPTISDALDKESKLYTLQPILSKARGAATVAGKAGASMSDLAIGGAAVLGHPIVGAGAFAAKKIGESPKALGAFGDVLRGAGKLQGANLSPVLQNIFSKGGAAVGAGGTLPFGQPSQESQTNKEDTTQNIQSDASISNPTTENKSITGFTPEKLGRAYMLALVSGNTKAAEQLKNLYDVETKYQEKQSTGEKLTAPQQLRHDNLQTALSSLDAAETNLVTAGGSKGVLGLSALIPGLGQVLDPSGAAYHSTKIELATQLAKAITGGARPGAEVIQQYLHSLPDVNDQPKFAAEKIRKIRAELIAQAKSFQYKDILNAYQQ